MSQAHLYCKCDRCEDYKRKCVEYQRLAVAAWIVVGIAISFGILVFSVTYSKQANESVTEPEIKTKSVESNNVTALYYWENRVCHLAIQNKNEFPITVERYSILYKFGPVTEGVWEFAGKSLSEDLKTESYNLKIFDRSNGALIGYIKLN